MPDQPIIAKAARNEADAIRYLNASNANLAAITRRSPAFFAAIATEATSHIGYPTSTPGASPGPGGTPRHTCDRGDFCEACDPGTSSLTERAALATRIHDQRAAEAANKLKIIADASAALLALFRPFAAEPEPVRCSGGAGREGAIEWGRPDCGEVPERGGMCDACAKREYRWRRDHNLPARTSHFAA